jgi:hypothetical protein
VSKLPDPWPYRLAATPAHAAEGATFGVHLLSKETVSPHRGRRGAPLGRGTPGRLCRAGARAWCAEIEHRRLGGVEVVDYRAEMQLLGQFLGWPSG